MCYVCLLEELHQEGFAIKAATAPSFMSPINRRRKKEKIHLNHTIISSRYMDIKGGVSQIDMI